MASYWQAAKREAKKRARVSGYCWVYPNPTSDMKAYWKQPFCFYESSTDALPPWVPKTASRFGDGPYVEPEPEPPTLFDLEAEVRDLRREIYRLTRDLD